MIIKCDRCDNNFEAETPYVPSFDYYYFCPVCLPIIKEKFKQWLLS